MRTKYAGQAVPQVGNEGCQGNAVAHIPPGELNEHSVAGANCVGTSVAVLAAVVGVGIAFGPGYFTGEHLFSVNADHQPTAVFIGHQAVAVNITLAVATLTLAT